MSKTASQIVLEFDTRQDEALAFNAQKYTAGCDNYGFECVGAHVTMTPPGFDGPGLVRQTIEARRDGTYRILEVKSGSIRSGFKALVEATETDERINLDIPSGTLSEEQLESLKRGEWEKKPLYMQINVSIRDGQIVKATLSHAGLRE